MAMSMGGVLRLDGVVRLLIVQHRGLQRPEIVDREPVLREERSVAEQVDRDGDDAE